MLPKELESTNEIRHLKYLIINEKFLEYKLYLKDDVADYLEECILHRF